MKAGKKALALTRHRLILWIGLVLLLLACLAAFMVWQQEEHGKYAEIKVGGVCVTRLLLSRDEEYVVPQAGGYNVVVIQNGKAMMQTSDCPDQTCVQSRAVSRRGESIVCLPHQVVITIKSSKRSGLLEVNAEFRFLQRCDVNFE